MRPATPRPWLAALLALLCNGLGHLYAGRLAGAVVVQVLWLATAMTVAAALRVGPVALAVAAVAATVFWVAQAVHAVAVARGAADAPRPRFSTPTALGAFYAATVAVSYLIFPSYRAAVGHTVYVPAGSMVPTVQVGDVLAVASGRPHTLRGAVVEVKAPAGSRSPNAQLKRIVAVAGDVVEIRDGALWLNDAPVPREPVPGKCTYLAQTSATGWRDEPCLDFVETLDGRAFHTHCTPGYSCGDVPRQLVPPGQVWLAGDHRDHSADSRVFGPVAESTILGEARWVLLRWGPLGPRWDRTGRPIR